MRVYPHQQNTGGFFITVFEKVEDSTEAATEKLSSETPALESEGPQTKKIKVEEVQKKERLPRDANEEPFVFVDPQHEALKVCWDFYGIDNIFDRNTCLVRNATGEPTRVVYTVCPALKDVIQANDDRLKIIYSGVKLFVSQRSDIECSWRIQSESLPIMKHHMKSNRIVEANLEMLKHLLIESFPNFDDIRSKNIDNDFVEKMTKLSSGCAFIDVSRNDPAKENLFLPVWKGNKCINLMVCKEDTHELLYRIFGIDANAKATPSAEEKEKETTESSAETTTGTSTEAPSAAN